MHGMTRLLSADASCVHLSSRYPCLTGSLYVSSTSISSLPPWKQQLNLQLYIDIRSSSTRSHHVRSCASQPVVCATPAALLVLLSTLAACDVARWLLVKCGPATKCSSFGDGVSMASAL